MTVSSDGFRPTVRTARAPRVAYSASVRLSGDFSDREPCFVPLLGQSLDLSEGGMSVVTSLQLQLGSAVTCSMRIGGCQIYAVGSVAWERVGDDGMRRVGIRFLTPSDEDTRLMRRLLVLGKTHPHRVQVRFDGRPDALSALAQITRTGLALTAPLPILRRDTGVRFAFDGGGNGSGNGNGREGVSFHGRIEHVRLSQLEGMPALQVGIRVPDVRAMQRAADDTAYKSLPALAASAPREDATPPGVEVALPVPVPDAERSGASLGAWSRALRARASTLRVSIPVGVLLGLGAIGGGALVRELAQPVYEGGINTLAEHGSAEQAGPRANEPAPRANELASTVDAPKPPRSPSLGAVASAPARVAVLEPAPAPELVPSFKWRRDRREIFVPLQGDLNGLHHFRMSSPPGIAIDVPHARGPIRAKLDATKRHAVRRPGVHRVDIAPAASGTKIRIWLRQPLDSYRVEPAKGGVRVVLPGPFVR